ncbi:uncharacterized protein DUF3231 [Bacillus oleivorans]|uniref:Uncharacterized protein DUF3231 n=1 Tax=Bacillus oleivorans TaxID=1448271 RepID=A0A285CMK8_9BACI|nr:DUF3231 family protein [Bacillus oleivorans]SNX68655.1 uncharacterized protein DUF3231 [Bacillus oleivorans]
MNKVHITANEIGILWTQYVQGTMTIQLLSFLLLKSEDEEIKAIIQRAIDITKKLVQDIYQLFEEEKLPLPYGFNENDVDLDAPPLFIDPFPLSFIETMFKAGMVAYAVSLAASSREDIRTLFTDAVSDTMQLFNACTETSLNKGIFVHSPQIKVQKEVEFVEGKRYLSPFQKRILNTIEITHLFENIKTNTVGEMVCTAFAQTTQSKEVRNYMERGKNISAKHIQIFSDALRNSDIMPAMPSTVYVTDSSFPVYSDRLMMFFLTVLSATGQGNYSAASTASMRYDLIINYQRLSAEIALFAKDGLDYLIKHGYLEEPPQALDRQEIMKHDKHQS